jgi:Hsp20/alpha crystallin family
MASPVRHATLRAPSEEEMKMTVLPPETVLLPERGAVHLAETERELIVEVEVPRDVDPAQLAAHLGEGVLRIELPRARRMRHHMRGFHPEATGV